MLVLPDLSVTVRFGRRCCPLMCERCRVRPSHVGDHGTGAIPTCCDPWDAGGGHRTTGFPWEKVAQP